MTRCKKCKSDQVGILMWVNPNNLRPLKDMPVPENEPIWCFDCDKESEIYDDEERT